MKSSLAGCDLDTLSEETSVAVVLASGTAALAGEQAEKSCAETLSSASHIYQCLVPVRNSWTKKKKIK